MYLTKLLLSTLIALTLFVGGIVIFLARIPFWSAFLGIGATQTGIVFLIFTYEQVSKNAISDELEHSFHTPAHARLHHHNQRPLLER